MAKNRLVLALAVAFTVSGCASLSDPQPADDPGQAGSAQADSTQADTVQADSVQAGASQRGRGDSLLAPKDAGTAAPVPPAPVDLWGRIRNGFKMQVRNDPRVEAELTYFASHPEYMARTVDRAEPYLHYIVQEVEHRGLPSELALLPVIESAFQPFAYSRARAAGIWQFIPSTGSHFGLKQNWWYDGRRDVVASTTAALDYLERLYKQFNDWELALAAYNAGEGTVQRAINAATRRGQPTDFWNLRLPRETRSYVPRLLAVRALVADPASHGLTLRSLPNEPYLTVVEVGSQIDLKLVAELTALPLDEIYRLNPGFNRWATDPNGPHLLLLPIDKAEPFQLALASLPENRRVRWARHQVARGETLSHIAVRYRTTVEVVKQVNELRGSFLRAGQHLLVPVAQQSPAGYVAKADEQSYRSLLKAISRAHTHKVRPGDTLWDLARKYDVTPAQIAKWSKMRPSDTLRVGQTLVVAAPSADMTRAVAAGSASSAKAARKHYTVRRGDSLYEIAKRFDVTIDDLRRWNRLPKGRYLQPGQRLTVAVTGNHDEESI